MKLWSFYKATSGQHEIRKRMLRCDSEMNKNVSVKCRVYALKLSICIIGKCLWRTLTFWYSICQYANPFKPFMSTNCEICSTLDCSNTKHLYSDIRYYSTMTITGCSHYIGRGQWILLPLFCLFVFLFLHNNNNVHNQHTYNVADAPHIQLYCLVVSHQGYSRI